MQGEGPGVEKVLVNVLGYRAKSKAALAGRRGSLRTGVVAIRGRDVRDTHLLVARHALQVRTQGHGTS